MAKADLSATVTPIEDTRTRNDLQAEVKGGTVATFTKNLAAEVAKALEAGAAEVHVAIVNGAVDAEREPAGQLD